MPHDNMRPAASELCACGHDYGTHDSSRRGSPCSGRRAGVGKRGKSLACDCKLFRDARRAKTWRAAGDAFIAERVRRLNDEAAGAVVPVVDEHDFDELAERVRRLELAVDERLATLEHDPKTAGTLAGVNMTLWRVAAALERPANGLPGHKAGAGDDLSLFRIAKAMEQLAASLEQLTAIAVAGGGAKTPRKPKKGGK